MRYLSLLFLMLLLFLSPLAGHATPQAYHAMEKEVLETLETPRLTAIRVERELGDSYYISCEYADAETLNGKPPEIIFSDASRRSFNNIEEAQALLSFPVAAHTYLPRDYEIADALVWVYPDDVIGDEITVEYRHVSNPPMVIEGRGYSPNNIVIVAQQYVGPEATMRLTTTCDISTLERASRQYVLLINEGYPLPLYELHWLEGGFYFSVSSDQFYETLHVAEGIDPQAI